MPTSQIVRITFVPTFPKQLQKETLKALRRWTHILKREIVELRVFPGDDGDGLSESVAAISTQRCYHHADLWLSSKFFVCDAEEQSQYVLHEFLHVLFDPLTTEISHIIFNFVADETMKRHLREQISDIEERLVDGVSHALAEDS